MDDNVRFIGFTDEELRDKVNVEGMDAIHIDCDFNISIFSLLMKLGAEVRFKALRNLNYVVRMIQMVIRILIQRYMTMIPI